MSTEQFNVMRKELVENVTGAAQDWLAYMGTASALAAIPDTEPPRYVVAGTLADIVKLLPAAEEVRDAARWKAWSEWWRNSGPSEGQLPPEVVELMNSLDLDDAMLEYAAMSASQGKTEEAK